MSDYRRLYFPGGTYFFTLGTYRRQPIFADDKRVEQLRRSFREVKTKRPFDLLAAVVLPDHLHCLWRLPEGDADFSTRWQMVKTDFSRHVPAQTRKGGTKPFGSRVSMIIASATKTTSTNILITSITIRSNMAWRPRPANGRIALLSVLSRLVGIHTIGVKWRLPI
ncbi:MAG: REP-associated tyrosine transposase [Methylobacter sp.]